MKAIGQRNTHVPAFHCGTGLRLILVDKRKRTVSECVKGYGANKVISRQISGHNFGEIFMPFCYLFAAVSGQAATMSFRSLKFFPCQH